MTRLVLALLTTLVACGQPPVSEEPVPGYSSVVASRDCPPAGGAATTVVLRPESADFDATGPQLRIAVWRSVEDLAGKSFASTDRPSLGGGFECTTTEDCQELETWGITFTDLAADSSITGVLEAAVPGGQTRRGSFHAVWHSRKVYCI
jgi:hypothetical protein